MQRLRVATLNLWAQHGPWAARAELIRAELLAQVPDLVAMQEVLGFSDGTTQLDRLCAPLLTELYPHRAHAVACKLAGSSSFAERTFGNGLLSRFPIREQHNLALPNPRGREPRALLCSLVGLPVGLLPVFVTHLDWELDGSLARCAQVRFIADQIDFWVSTWTAASGQPLEGAASPSARDVLPPILAGDFNAEPQSDEIRFLTGHHPLAGASGEAPRGVYFSDCYTRAVTPEDPDPDDSPGAPGATFVRRNRFAARAREPDRRLDYIFAALPDRRGRGQPLRAWRCFRESVRESTSMQGPGQSSPADRTTDDDRIWASDHYGVAVDFSL